MNQTLWIARHGNRLDFVCPEWFNKAKRRYDPPLSRDGRIQAKELAQRLKKESIQHIFVSPFLRSIQTANEVAEVLNLSLKIEAGLSEWLNPLWMSEIPKTQPKEELQKDYTRIDWHYQSLVIPQYPETEIEMIQRCEKTINQIITRFSDNILLVGHSASVKGTTLALVKDNVSLNTPLCCLVKLVNYNNNWILELNGDISHLSHSKSQIYLPSFP